MAIFVFTLSRLVPLLFLISLTLVGSRYAHDLVLRTRPRLARWVFVAVSLVGLLASAPYALRAGLIIGAKSATGRGRWKAADLLYAGYDSWNGSRSESSLRDWAYVRMNAGDWRGAEEVLELSGRRSPQTTMLIGLCQYYENKPAAQTTLSSVPDVAGTQLCVRDYLLGRLTQKRGDLNHAYQLYERSARWEADFFPSIYHGSRIALMGGNAALATSIVDGFVRQSPTSANDRDIQILRTSVRTNTLPPDKEFVVVSN